MIAKYALPAVYYMLIIFIIYLLYCILQLHTYIINNSLILRIAVFSSATSWKSSSGC